MEYDDYMLTVRGFKSKLQVVEGWFRRSTYIVAQTNCTKDISRSFNDWWPYGDKKLRIDMADVMKRRREQSAIYEKKLYDVVMLNDEFKKLKKNA